MDEAEADVQAVIKLVYFTNTRTYRVKNGKDQLSTVTTVTFEIRIKINIICLASYKQSKDEACDCKRYKS